MADNDWSEGIANLESLAAQFAEIERKALRAVADVIRPRLAQAAPVRVNAKQGGNSLPEDALKAAVRGHIHKGTSVDDPTQVIVDFGKLSHIRAPHARALSRAGLKVTGKPTAAHPFVRSVQDSSAAAAQTAYEETMQMEIEKVLQGN